MTVQRAEVLDSAYAHERAVMISRHLRARGIEDHLLLVAMGAVPREAFVPEHLQEFSYEDSALPIEAGQTISQPYIVARMLELAEIKPGDKVLEVGAGSGYAAAVMSRMANRVFAIERHEELAMLSRSRLKRLGYANAEIIIADGTKGLTEEAPFQAIIERPAPSGAAAIRLHPLPNLDVAQRPGGGLPRPVEGDQRHDRRPRSQGWLLRAR